MRGSFAPILITLVALSTVGPELVVAQSRERRGWVHGNRSISGITGVTKVGVTCENEKLFRQSEIGLQRHDDVSGVIRWGVAVCGSRSGRLLVARP